MHPHATAATHPERLAIVTDDGETRTYAELAASAWRIARLLRALGLQAGDHVALCMENGPEMLEVLWGAHTAGLLYTACSTQLTPDELAYVVDDCDAKAFVGSASLARGAETIRTTTPKVVHRFCVGGGMAGHVPLEGMLAGVSDAPLEGAVAGADMLYSSGTTGRPKGITPSPERPPLDAPEMFTGVMQQVLGFRRGDVYLSPAPLYHAAPLRGCMSVHRLGGTVVLMRRFDPEAVLALVERHRVTHAQFVPTMFLRMLRLDARARERYDLSSLRSVVHASAPCPAEVKRRMIDWWGPIIHEYYGGTEGCGVTWVTSEEWLAHPGTVGRAVVGVVHVLDEDGAELPAGETGTIWFSDGPPFRYHKDPAKTADAHNAAGWATYGDIGRLEADGYLHLTDRKADTIITGGVNVYPREAEDVLVTHPLVLDAAVFGIPDDEFGERVHAVVQPAELPADPSAAAELEATLIAHCRARLARVKCPRGIEFRAELPRHETGKLHKRLLVEEHRAAASA
ncbi:MAG: acyl-CoA synthetase [Actinomycetota bacterium]|nr:acyl-CoA synthetase [Actinomycetota bacterium]